MANLYRKAVMDKISSPEQLDKSIIIIAPSFWVAGISGLLIIAVALIWSIFGRLPVNVSAGGMYMGADGIQSVVAEADGIVEAVYVSEGDDVKQGQKLAQLDSTAYDEEISALNERKANVECVTFYSYDDPATADTKILRDIKSQAGVADTGLTSDQITLRERYKALSKQRSVTSNAKSKRNSALKRLNRVQKKYSAAKKEFNAASSAMNDAQIAYNTYYKEIGDQPTDEQKLHLEELRLEITAAEKEYNAAAAKLQPLEAEKTKAEAAYSVAEQTYSSEKAKKQQLEDTVSQLEAKVKADKSGTGKQMSSLEEQFDSAKGSVLDQLNQELARQQKAAERMTLRSRADGKVTGVSIAKGNAVQTGMPVCMISFDTDGEEAVLFVPVSEGKKIKKDMHVIVYPSTVNRQETGHMTGKVTGVSKTVISSQEMINQLGEQSLAQVFQQSGPVIRVSCSLDKDEKTASGYKWSSKKGADIELDAGTIVQADIVVEEKAPITMLIPLIKDKLSVNREQSPQNSEKASQSAKG